MPAPSLPPDILDRNGLPPGMSVQEREQQLQRHVLHDPRVRILTLVRFCTSLGLTTLAYGVMVYLATTGTAQAVISLVGALRFLTALLFGLGGGALAELMTSRSALIVTYTLQAAACFIVPTFWGSSLGSLLFLVFIETTLGQLGTPAIKAATAEVTIPAQVAVAAAILSVASGIGAAVGSAFVAPVLINVATMTAVIYASGVALALSAVRVWQLPAAASTPPLMQALRGVKWHTAVPSPRRTAAWVLENRRFAAMILVGGMAAALYEGMNSLLPVYVRDVLGANPTNTVFIIAPGGLGFLAGSALGPWLMDHRGERALLIYALAILSLGFALFGLIEQVTPFLAPLSPLGLLDLFGFHLSPQMKAAGLISILTMFGSTAASAAVQTYVNRYVMLARQATTFGMQELLDNLLVLVTLVALGAIATVLGPRLVFLCAPPLLMVLVVSLIWASFHVTANEPPEVQAILRSIFNPAPWNSSASPEPPGPG
ncbi:MAG: MFS transporter [Chloroflexota bacterium]|nr:MFS transporter [Chloroflexota bacterium]